VKIIAIIASYNEERFIKACLEHYFYHGIYVYLLDNQSTDNTVNIAKTYFDKNLIGLDIIPRRGKFELKKQLLAKEKLIDKLEADWFIHADVDEFRLPPDSSETLAQAIERVDKKGYNAINFMEYTFLPVREFPHHESDDFQNTMRWYYPFAPQHPHRLNAWKKQPLSQWPGFKKTVKELINNRRCRAASVNLCKNGGHVIEFNGIRPYPIDFKMRHYLVLSLEHAIQKYVLKSFDSKEASSMHGWRATAAADEFLLPSVEQMRYYQGDDALDPNNPLKEHLIVQRKTI